MLHFGYAKSVSRSFLTNSTCLHKIEDVPGLLLGGYSFGWWNSCWGVYCFREPESLFSDASRNYFPLKSLPELDN